MKFGAAVRRTEDARFITGRGEYTDDIVLPGMLHGAFLRSPYAHATISGLDIAAARAAPGVKAVIVHDDLAKAGLRGISPAMALKNRDGSTMARTEQPLLADGRVRYVGAPIAFVVADTPAQARDAAELIAFDADPLPAYGTIGAAAGAETAIWDQAPGNLAFDWQDGDAQAVDAAFARAAQIVSLEVAQNRVVPNPMEPRSAIGLVRDGRLELHSGNQGAANLRDRIAYLLNVPHDALRVVTPDVGGGFGMKMFPFPEQALVVFAARLLDRPVKWTGDRSEAFLADTHGREAVTKGELAFDAEHRILAMRIAGRASLGAFGSTFGPFIPTMAGGRIWGGVYRVPALYANIRGYYTNAAPIDAYRGAGRPEAAYLMERLMDTAARVLNADPVALRAKNLLTPGDLPYKSWRGVTIDSGDFPRLLDRAASRTEGFETRKAASERAGKLRGRGLAYYVEITAPGHDEPARIRFTENGMVEIAVGTQSNGQGHETTFAQLVSARLGVPQDQIQVVQGDTDLIGGSGTGGSKSLHLAGGALMSSAEEVVRKGAAAAAHFLNAPPDDVAFAVEGGVGRFVAKGPGGERAMPLLEVAVRARTAPDLPEAARGGLDSGGAYTGPSSTFPNGCHVCEVEIDPETGVVKLDRYDVVDDFGVVLNPMVVAGQVHGGIAQGVGQALLENCVYDAETGQLVSGSFMDYAMPRADDMPAIGFETVEIPCKTNPLGIKGCGEAGTVGALPAVMGAIADALALFGFEHLDMPATPEKVWRAIRGI